MNICEYIKEAEQLFIDGNEFDPERKKFINTLDNCDLLAVPGSGKTTALMAKLYCLSKFLPFKDGSGILVLSHTNAAVDEIEKNLRKHCPILFQYPNYVGTIQGFVNKFLAGPACMGKYGTYPVTVDNDIAKRFIEKKVSLLDWNNPLGTFLFFQIYNQCAVINKNLLVNEFEFTATSAKEFLKKLKELKAIKKGSLVYSKVCNDTSRSQLGLGTTECNVVKQIHERTCGNVKLKKNALGGEYKLDFNNNVFLSGTGKFGFVSKAGDVLLEIYENLFRQGILRYEDCYSLGFWYIQQYPKIITILRKRFKYVFIDEMQDLEKSQIDLIDSIFYDEKSPTIIQRIGDINQSIYHSGKRVKVECDWCPRHQKYLKNSLRLTDEVAEVVNYFTLNREKDESGSPRFIVIGKKYLEHPIKPHLIVFDEQSKGLLKNEFEKLIREFKLIHTKEGQKYGFKIIGWNAKWENNEHAEGKLRLEDIFDGYKKESNNRKEEFNTLSKCLVYSNTSNILKENYNAILSAFCAVLRIGEIKQKMIIRGREIERCFTRQSLYKYIEENELCDEQLFKANLYKWSFELATLRNVEEVYSSMRLFICNEFKTWLGLNLSQDVLEFVGEKCENIPEIKMITDDKQEDSLKIDIETVHAAKGQTHCATMYVETSYYFYETEKLKVTGRSNPLYKEEHQYKKEGDARAKETMKMMYVGFSRPTHLLCFAVFQEHVKDDLALFRSKGWEVIQLDCENE